MGYVGLPLAIAFSKKRQVIGFDTNKKRINNLKLGHDSTCEVSKKKLLRSKKLTFTNKHNDLINCNCIIITVPTPINKNMKPDFSHIISDLIDTSNKIFKAIEAEDFIDWGTKEEWFSSNTIKNTYLFDIDGVVLFNTGKYGRENWFNTIKPIEENVNTIKQLSDQGHEIIFITSRTQDAIVLFEEFLKNKKITYKTIIHSCLHSKRILVNDFASSNPFPSCLAINIPRNQSIESYLK
jgi:hypothetical protein